MPLNFDGTALIGCLALVLFHCFLDGVAVLTEDVHSCWQCRGCAVGFGYLHTLCGIDGERLVVSGGLADAGGAGSFEPHVVDGYVAVHIAAVIPAEHDFARVGEVGHIVCDVHGAAGCAFFQVGVMVGGEHLHVLPRCTAVGGIFDEGLAVVPHRQIVEVVAQGERLAGFVGCAQRRCEGGP